MEEQQKRGLVIEDRQNVRQLVKRVVLARLPTIAFTIPATSEELGVVLASEELFDVVLLDGEYDEWQQNYTYRDILDRLLARVLPDAVVVCICGKPSMAKDIQEDVRSRGRRSVYLGKPFQLNELLQAIG